ncbi:MAG: hypothetical protein B6244_03545 [Candidatus Cloacimonetes bacterium 4572_55]|nr:MAG: hypothetical protein B6244_03545 [Candidatus Cloacimonetes bacterium 4572_55]
MDKKTDEIRIEIITRLTKPIPTLMLRVSGKLDSTTVEKFSKKIRGYMEDRTIGFVLNFQKLEYVNSTALREILKIHHELKKKNGFVSFLSVNDNISDVISLVGISEVIPVYDSNQAFLNAIQKQKEPYTA